VEDRATVAVRLTGAVAATLIAAASARAQTAQVNTAGGVSVRTEAGHSTYGVGEPIFVRVVMTNTSGHNLSYISSGPFRLADLVIYDPDGRSIEPMADVGKRKISGATRTWLPQQEIGEWANISAWGYDLRSLRSPGRYRIVGIPIVGDPGAKYEAVDTGTITGTFITIEP
jgi:hypothetical protein